MQDPNGEKREREGEKVPPKRRRQVIAASVAGLALVLALGAQAVEGGLINFPTQKASDPIEEVVTRDGDGETPTEDSGDGVADAPVEQAHVHDWTITYKTVHHDAVTHTETVAPQYASETSYHTVCNDCGEVIDGIAEQHLKETAHSGYSTNVPIVNDVLVSEGYSHEVTDAAAYDETVPDKVVCVTCGETQEITAETVQE